MTGSKVSTADVYIFECLDFVDEIGIHASHKGKDFISQLKEKYPNLYLLKESIVKDCPILKKYIDKRNKDWYGDGSVDAFCKFCQNYAIDVDTTLSRL